VATWQADFNVVLSSGDLPPDYRTSLEALLPRATKTWTSEVEMWGVEDGDRIDVFTEPGSKPEVLVRFDMRRWNPGLYEGFLALLSRLDARLERAEDGEDVQLSLAPFMTALRESRAASFVRDPEAYFEELRRHPIGEDGGP